jgi:cobalt/nickel transport system permease protein
MHIPDGFLSTPVWATLDAFSAPGVVFMARKAQRELDHSKIPLLGVMGAFVFAAQMINFPVGIGTSGHLVGAALLAFTLGPAAASVVMTAILAIQALVFQDGGILALGANICNMGILGVLAGYLPFHLWGAGRFRKASIFLGGMLSVMAAATMAVSELLSSGVPMRGSVLAVSFALFVVSAVIEGAITLAVFQGIEALNPQWVKRPTASPKLTLGTVAAVAVFLAVVGVLFASNAPDGLQRLGQSLGISSQARTLISTPLADYQMAVFQSSWLRRASAGLAGLGLIYGACVLFGRLVSRRRSA